MRAKPTSQKRSLEKRNRILESLDVLLLNKPFSEISVAELAAKADVTPATIYQRFSNVDATASVLLELYYIKVEEWARNPEKSKPPAKTSLYESLEWLAEGAYLQVQELGHIMRPAYLYSRSHPGRTGLEWKRLEKVALEGFKSFISQWEDDLRVDSVDETAVLLANFFNLMLLGPLLHSDDAGWSSLGSRKQFSKNLATMAYRYLCFPTERER